MLAASIALAACSGGSLEPSKETVGEENKARAPEATGIQPGLYATGDGTQVYSRTQLNADGTYIDLNDAMGRVGGGTWEQRDELKCFDPEGDGENQQEMCWTTSEPNEDGSFVSTSVDGKTSYTISKIEE